jgi:hypothetical protein
MKPKIVYPRVPAGIGESLLKRFSLIGENPVMVQEADPAKRILYIISPIAKKDNPRF